MATFQMPSYYRQSPLTVDTHPQKFFEDDDNSILDENILDNGALDSGLEMSPPMDGSRRDSFAVSTTLFSPKSEDWHHVDMQSSMSHGSNNPFIGHSNNPFMRLPPAQAATYGHQTQAWAMTDSSGACTPMQHFDGLPAEFDNNVYQSMQAQAPFAQNVPLYSAASTSNGSMPTSPDHMEHRGIPKQLRSPTLRSHSPLLRRDGIRKKNARFEIPAERNLLNIDQLISQSTDEVEIKELKQQKRLLRNRQAALDSRQRKKQHTERLEDEKKHYTAAIHELEDDLAEAKMALDEWARKEQQWCQMLENLQLEKEEMVRAHTLETGDLRKKVSVLTDAVQKLESHAIPAPSTNTFTNEFGDIDTLTMDGAWDSISFLNDYPLDNDVQKSSTSMVTVKKAETPLVSEQDKPAAQGLLLMLLLVGAFVASKGSSPSIPRMSDDVRAASATLLEDVFKDAGVAQSNDHATSVIPHSAPLPSGNSWSTSMNGVSADPNAMVGVSSSVLGDLTDSLAQPSEEQQNDQLFSLSVEQYNGITSQDFLRSSPPKSTSQGRRNLAESLAAMRSNSKQSAAEVYTRSLLWDQVPSEVVRNFAKLVSECNSGNTPESIDESVG